MNKYRIKEQDGKFTIQWKLPLLPIWFNCTDFWDCPITFSTLAEAQQQITEWTKDRPTTYHNP